jgi:phosphatidylglycerophosphatase GEP4
MSKFKLGQFINLDGFLFTFKYLYKVKFNLRKLKPDLLCDSFSNINVNILLNNNIKYIVIDKDNTITFPHNNKIANDEILNKLNELKSIFSKDNICIVSNSAGSKDDKDYKEAREIEKTLNINVLRHVHKKPSVYNDIRQQFKINENNNKNVCVIGDRLLVDVIMGRENNFYTILVKPLTNKGENFVVKLIRKVENIILKYI